MTTPAIGRQDLLDFELKRVDLPVASPRSVAQLFIRS